MGQDAKEPTITVLGGTGHVGATYIEEFLAAGLRTRILARAPERSEKRFPRAEVVRGSMLDANDVARAMEGADAALLITPIGGNNDPGPELRAAASAIAAAAKARLPHLIYASQLLPRQPTGVAILDAKVEIEDRLAASGLAWSSLCIGCYMDEWLGMAPGLLRLGLLLNPLSKDRPFSFTCKQDVARVAITLVRQCRTLNGTLDVVEPTVRTLSDAAGRIGQVLGRRVVASGRWPLLPLMRAARGLLRRAKPILVSKIELGTYFDSHGYVGRTTQMAEVLPGFPVTSLDEYLRRAFKAAEPAR
ncbi:MAG TPA: NAD(P)H-binding protein [Vicinamibacteria bacterium]|nr:NAD(P)H-binding protein [Vicinamibacteria bacterium]